MTIVIGSWIVPLLITVAMVLLTRWRVRQAQLHDGFIGVQSQLTAMVWSVATIAVTVIALGAWFAWTYA